MSTQEAKRILYILKKNYGVKTLGFTGGEPFCRNDLFEILKFSKKIGLKNAVGTNGSLIGDHIDNIKKYIDTLIVSYDGFSRFFSYITQTDYYDKVEENLLLLKNNKIKFGIHTNIVPQNLGQFEKIMEKIINFGASFAQVGDIQALASKKDGRKIRKLILSQEQKELLFKKILKFNKSKKGFILHHFIRLSDLKKCKNNLGGIKKYFSAFFVISPDGSVYPMVDTFSSQ